MSPRFRNAYDRRDVDAALDLFADDAVLAFAPRAFKGKDEMRQGLEWDSRLSPTSKTRLSGIEAARQRQRRRRGERGPTDRRRDRWFVAVSLDRG